MGKIIEAKLPHRSARFERYANRNQPIELIRALAAYDYQELYDVIVKALTESEPYIYKTFNLIFSDGAIIEVNSELMWSIRQNLETYVNGYEKELEAYYKNLKVPIYSLRNNKIYSFVGYEPNSKTFTFKAYGSFEYSVWEWLPNKEDLRPLQVGDIVTFADENEKHYSLNLKVTHVNGYTVKYEHNPIFRINHGEDIWEHQVKKNKKN